MGDLNVAVASKERERDQVPAYRPKCCQSTMQWRVINGRFRRKPHYITLVRKHSLQHTSQPLLAHEVNRATPAEHQKPRPDTAARRIIGGSLQPNLAVDRDGDILSIGGDRIAKSIRDLCIFARQDVTRDPPFSRLDLVSCRNLLIYLDSAAQRRIMQVFHLPDSDRRFSQRSVPSRSAETSWAMVSR